MNASTNDNRFLSALRAFVRPVFQEWPLWLTMLLTLVPLSWQSLEYHWRWFHELPAGVFVGMVCNMSVVAVAATLVVWLITKLPHRRLIKTLIYILLFAQWIVALFLMRNFHTSYTPEVLKLLAETNRGESSEFLRTWIAAPGTVRALMIAGFTLVLVLIAEAKRRPVANFLSHPVTTVLTAALLAAMLLQGIWLGHKLVMPYHNLYDLEISEARYHSNDGFSTLHSSLLTLPALVEKLQPRKYASCDQRQYDQNYDYFFHIRTIFLKNCTIISFLYYNILYSKVIANFQVPPASPEDGRGHA